MLIFKNVSFRICPQDFTTLCLKASAQCKVHMSCTISGYIFFLHPFLSFFCLLLSAFLPSFLFSPFLLLSTSLPSCLPFFFFFPSLFSSLCFFFLLYLFLQTFINPSPLIIDHLLNAPCTQFSALTEPLFHPPDHSTGEGYYYYVHLRN